MEKNGDKLLKKIEGRKKKSGKEKTFASNRNLRE